MVLESKGFPAYFTLGSNWLYDFDALTIDQQKAASSESDFCVSCFSEIATLLTMGRFAPKFSRIFANHQLLNHQVKG